MSGRCLKAVCRVSQKCLEGIYGMSEWYARCLDVSEGQVGTSQVRIGKVRTGHVRTCQVRTGPVWKVFGNCLEGVWLVFGGCLAGVLWLSGGYLMGVWKVS